MVESKVSSIARQGLPRSRAAVRSMKAAWKLQRDRSARSNTIQNRNLSADDNDRNPSLRQQIGHFLHHQLLAVEELTFALLSAP